MLYKYIYKSITNATHVSQNHTTSFRKRKHIGQRRRTEENKQTNNLGDASVGTILMKFGKGEPHLASQAGWSGTCCQACSHTAPSLVCQLHANSFSRPVPEIDPGTG